VCSAFANTASTDEIVTQGCEWQDALVELQDFLDHVNRGEVIGGGSELHLFMHGTA
jgi:hypothetical protein